jgi:hypothetical protein
MIISLIINVWHLLKSFQVTFANKKWIEINNEWSNKISGRLLECDVSHFVHFTLSWRQWSVAQFYKYNNSFILKIALILRVALIIKSV